MTHGVPFWWPEVGRLCLQEGWCRVHVMMEGCGAVVCGLFCVRSSVLHSLFR